MPKNNMHAIIALVVMITVIVSVDLLLFRHHTLARLMSNVGIVLLLGAIYLAFLRSP